MIDDKDKIYMSSVYIDALNKAMNSIYTEEELDHIQTYDFNKNDDCYIIEVINTTIGKISTFIIYKDTCDINYINENGYEKTIIW